MQVVCRQALLPVIGSENLLGQGAAAKVPAIRFGPGEQVNGRGLLALELRKKLSRGHSQNLSSTALTTVRATSRLNRPNAESLSSK